MHFSNFSASSSLNFLGEKANHLSERLSARADNEERGVVCGASEFGLRR